MLNLVIIFMSIVLVNNFLLSQFLGICSFLGVSNKMESAVGMSGAVIAALVQFVEMFMKKFMPALQKSLGIYLPLITTNCAILGATINAINYNYTYIQAIVYTAGAGVGFGLAMVLFAGVREEKLWNEEGVPAAFKGVPMVLVSATILSLSFMGFSGLFQ